MTLIYPKIQNKNQNMEVTNMKKFAMLAGLMMVAGCFMGLAYGLDPLDNADANADPDRDGLENWMEYNYASDPNDPDTDAAGAYDGWEVWYETHRAVDADACEYIDVNYHFDPNNAVDEGVVANTVNLIQVRDSDANKLTNDPDGDGWNNLHEFLVGTDPTNPNTDGDMYPEDSADPDPLVSNDDHTGGGGNGGPGSGVGEAVAHA
jgi:hypothetical protein